MKRKEHHPPAEEPLARRTRRKVAANSGLEPEKRSSTVYTYTPLQNGHIRLLRLDPKKPWESLSGDLIHCPLIDAPEFVALSYVWGSDQTPYYLETSQGKLTLTKSLNSGLQKLRRTLDSQNKQDNVAFWADAICINQKDNSEKSEQVKIMANIYQRATVVVIDLGSASGIDIEKLFSVVFETESATDEESIIMKEVEEIENDDMMAIMSSLNKFLLLPWFERRWIIQEFCVAKRLLAFLGNKLYRWEVLEVVIAVAKQWDQKVDQSSLSRRWRQHLWNESSFSNLCITRYQYQEGKRHSLFELVQYFIAFRTTRARDVFFALTGLSSDAQNEAFFSDYTSLLPSVVLRLGTTFIQQGNAPQMLHIVGAHAESPFPSWIPDWTNGLSGPKLSDKFLAGISPKKKGTYTVNGDVLTARGCVVDNIADLSEFTIFWERERGHYSSAVRIHLEILHMLNETFRLKTPEELHDITCRILVADVSLNGREKLIKGNHAFRQFLSICSDEDLMTELLDEDTLWQNKHFTTMVTQFQEYLLPVLAMAGGGGQRGRFAITNRKLAGMVPGWARAGDAVCILYGCKVPFILRKCPRSRNKFRILGGCYIDGIMYGEALSFKGIEERDIQIR